MTGARGSRRTRADQGQRTILHLLDDLQTGGAQQVLVDLANRSAADGQEVIVASAGGPMSARLSAEVRHLSMPSRPGTDYLFRLVRLLRSTNIDIIHAHQRGVATMANIARFTSGCRVVEHVHTRLPTADHKFISYRSSRLIAVSGAVQEMLVVNYCRESQRVRLIANGVKDNFKTPPSSPIWTKGEPLRLLAIGRVSEQKDPSRFLELIDAINLAGVSCVGRWLGDGPLRDEMMGITLKRGLQNVVTWEGESNSVFDALKWCHSLAILSAWEGLPLVVLESFSAARPVIATAVGGIPEIVDDSVGILVSPETPARDLARTVIERYNEKLELRALGDAARERYQKSFTMERVYESVNQIYAELA